ncbi:hypothetical protein CCM_08793 [Cordyceps militaris CM01]|uniref:Uncharacterized protein n=1 Tax=Cordyceps militaris (strain CM01) TaxID=983644 RepID=G3JSF5_CORMM|nr:uncharacterized protein CCM_08793 [Cordyceps militaris CM01]EGX88747.1 hypothetical protein CCM_08793 [Cordyceps militaris CM01]
MAMAKRLEELGPTPELEWAHRPIWGQYIHYLYEQAKGNNSTQQLRQSFRPVVNSTARDFLALEYPECAEAGTISSMRDEEWPFGSAGAANPSVATTLWMTVDQGQNGILYDCTLVIHSPAAWTSIARAPQTKLAQRYLASVVQGLDEDGVNVRHAVLSVVVGAVMLSARYKPRNLMPSCALVSENAGPEISQPTARDEGSDDPGSPQHRLFRPRLFMSVLDSLETSYPGCTVWDAGEMTFDIDDAPYPYPARLLVCRAFEQRNSDVKTFDFRVRCPGDNGRDVVATLVRARDPSDDPGGIVCLAVVVPVDPQEAWPKRDLDKHRPVMLAALTQASKHGMVMAFRGGFDRCALRVWVGQDTTHYMLITPHAKGETAEHVRQFSEVLFGGSLTSLTPAAHPQDMADLEETFGVQTERKDEHRLWDSESHFQHIRHQMRRRAKAFPARYERMGLVAGHQSAVAFMERNFAGCVIADEGELPQSSAALPGARVENTKVLVARDPEQVPGSIVAVLVAAPCPVPGYSAMTADRAKTWLGTPEMRSAEEALMALLKTWHGEGRISKRDCFVQVMMGMDATIYQFVDGHKFVDPSEERMRRIRWQ